MTKSVQNEAKATIQFSIRCTTLNDNHLIFYIAPSPSHLPCNPSQHPTLRNKFKVSPTSQPVTGTTNINNPPCRSYCILRISRTSPFFPPCRPKWTNFRPPWPENRSPRPRKTTLLKTCSLNVSIRRMIDTATWLC